jgi:hypothetical protein
MMVLPNKGCEVGSKNKDKSSEEACWVRKKFGRKTSIEVDKTRASSCRIRASEEAKAGERGREGRALLPWKLDQETGQGRKAGKLRALSLSRK